MVKKNVRNIQNALNYIWSGLKSFQRCFNLFSRLFFIRFMIKTLIKYLNCNKTNTLKLNRISPLLKSPYQSHVFKFYCCVLKIFKSLTTFSPSLTTNCKKLMRKNKILNVKMWVFSQLYAFRTLSTSLNTLQNMSTITLYIFCIPVTLTILNCSY